jgi:hypothetical protein
MQRRCFLPAALAAGLAARATLQRPVAPEVVESRVRVVEARLPGIRPAARQRGG